MSLLSVMQAVQDLIVPTGAYPAAIPAANVTLWYPETILGTYPYCVIAPIRPSVRRARTLKQWNELHWVMLDLLEDPAQAGGNQAAQANVNAWIEAAKANLRRYPQLPDASGNARCMEAGQTKDGQGTESHLELQALDESSGVVVCRGYLVIPIEDLFTS